MRRKIIPPPIIHKSPLPVLQEPELVVLPNGLRIFVLRSGTLEVLKMEVVIEAGRPHEMVRSTARATAKLIREGSRNYTAQAFAELIDFHGASLSVPTHLDVAVVQLHTLRRHAQALVPAVADAIMHPAFSQQELNIFVQNAIAELTVDLSKPESLAYRYLTEYMYGAEHPYGYNSTSEMYQALRREDLVAFHEACYRPERTAIVLSGSITPEVLKIIEDAFGSWSVTARSLPFLTMHEAPHLAPEKRRIPFKSSEQTAIKLGRRLFNRHHPDYLGMGLLNTILGGYFGSRLMTNIREKQGITYNIYSSFDVMRADGFLYIASEVNKRKVNKALTAIYGEMKRLQDEPIPEQEMQMVLNYISGMMLLAVDGPLNQSNLLKSLVIDGLSVQHFHSEMAELSSFDVARMQQLAQQWLHADHFWEVIV